MTASRIGAPEPGPTRSPLRRWWAPSPPHEPCHGPGSAETHGGPWALAQPSWLSASACATGRPARWASVLVMAIGFFAGHLPRIAVEERVLEESLGARYRAYERMHRRLIPGVW